MKKSLIRIFIAIEIPDKVKKELAEALVELKGLAFSIRWVEPKNLHFTLSFLGNVEKNKLNNLYRVVEKSLAGAPSFVVKLSKIVCLPNFRKPRVIALALGGDVEILEKLQKQIEKSLLDAGFTPKTRTKFSPHLTLGRVRKKVKRLERIKLGRKLLNFSFGFGQEFKVNSVTIFKSDLSAYGPVYTKLRGFRLSRTDKL